MKYTVKLTHGTNAPTYITVEAPSELEAKVEALRLFLVNQGVVDPNVIKRLAEDYRYMISEGC